MTKLVFNVKYPFQKPLYIFTHVYYNQGLFMWEI